MKPGEEWEKSVLVEALLLTELYFVFIKPFLLFKKHLSLLKGIGCRFVSLIEVFYSFYI